MMNPESITLGMALTAGLMGGGHCLAMCGGIACLPVAAAPPRRWRLLLFNGGRLVSYSAMGGLAGWLGATLTGALGGQAPAVLRLVAAALVGLVALHLLWPARFAAPGQRLGGRFWRRVAPLMGRLTRHNSLPATLGLGMLWGWLPCGLVYAMLGAAAVSGAAHWGAGVMLAFGLGTLPAMLLTGAAGRTLAGALRSGRGRMLSGAVLLVAALWTGWVPLSQLTSGTVPGHHHHASSAAGPASAVNLP